MKGNILYNFVKKYHITKSLFIGFFVAIFTILYFGYFIIFGDKGLITLINLNKQIENKEITKQEFLSKMRAQKNMVDGMNPNSLDVDLLDEQARKVLGYTGKNEVIIYQDNNK